MAQRVHFAINSQNNFQYNNIHLFNENTDGVDEVQNTTERMKKKIGKIFNFICTFFIFTHSFLAVSLSFFVYIYVRFIMNVYINDDCIKKKLHL